LSTVDPPKSNSNQDQKQQEKDAETMVRSAFSRQGKPNVEQSHCVALGSLLRELGFENGIAVLLSCVDKTTVATGIGSRSS
jgi:hypothetical protein